MTGSVASTQAVEEMNTVSAKNISLDKKPFINGTPAIVLEDGQVIPGYQPATQVAKLALAGAK